MWGCGKYNLISSCRRYQLLTILKCICVNLVRLPVRCPIAGVMQLYPRLKTSCVVRGIQDVSTHCLTCRLEPRTYFHMLLVWDLPHYELEHLEVIQLTWLQYRSHRMRKHCNQKLPGIKKYHHHPSAWFDRDWAWLERDWPFLTVKGHF